MAYARETPVVYQLEQNSWVHETLSAIVYQLEQNHWVKETLTEIVHYQLVNHKAFWSSIKHWEVLGMQEIDREPIWIWNRSICLTNKEIHDK